MPRSPPAAAMVHAGRKPTDSQDLDAHSILDTDCRSAWRLPPTHTIEARAALRPLRGEVRRVEVAAGLRLKPHKCAVAPVVGAIF